MSVSVVRVLEGGEQRVEDAHQGVVKEHDITELRYGRVDTSCGARERSSAQPLRATLAATAVAARVGATSLQGKGPKQVTGADTQLGWPVQQRHVLQWYEHGDCERR